MEAVPCSIFVISKDWKVREIKFPAPSIADTSKGRAVTVYNIDKISDLKIKYYLVTGKNATFVHFRGLPIKFDAWFKQVRDIGKSSPDKPNTDKITMIPKRIVNWAHLPQVYLGWNLPTADKTWPALYYKDKLVTPDLPQHAALRRDVTRISDIPTDQQGTQFEQLKPDFSDIFISDLSPVYHFVAIELDEYIKPNSPLALSIVNDENKRMRVYDGFIRKYFPLANDDLFIDYMRARTANVMTEFIIGYAEVELDVMDKLIENQRLTSAKAIDNMLELSVTSAIITTQASPSQTTLLLRNLFDKVHIGTVTRMNADDAAVVKRASQLHTLGGTAVTRGIPINALMYDGPVIGLTGGNAFTKSHYATQPVPGFAMDMMVSGIYNGGDYGEEEFNYDPTNVPAPAMDMMMMMEGGDDDDIQIFTNGISSNDGMGVIMMEGGDTTGTSLGIHKMYMNLYITPTYTGTMPVAPLRSTSMSHHKHYIISKRRANTNDYRIPVEFRYSGIVFVKAPIVRSVRARVSYIHILENGVWRYQAQWNPEDRTKIEDILNYAKTNTAKSIDHFNSLLPFYGKEPLLHITRSTSRISMLDAVFTWNMQITEPEYREVLRAEFRHFIEAKMASMRDAVHLEALWTKGMITPCVVKVVHGNTNVRIEIQHADARGLCNLVHILEVFVAMVYTRVKANRRSRHERQQRGDNDDDDSESARSKRIIKKLREQDPRLYDELKENNVYSRKCQGFRQPIILTETEYNQLSAADKKLVTKYRNFTQGKTAHYMCQKDPKSNQRMTFSFITGIHERGWCVPCCKKKESKDAEHNNRSKRDRECMQTGENKTVGIVGPQPYISVHSKPIKPNRLGLLPPSIFDIIHEGYYCYGVPQAFPATSRAGIVYAIASALDMSTTDYVMRIIEYIRRSQEDIVDKVLSLSLGHADTITFGSLSFGGKPNTPSGINIDNYRPTETLGGRQERVSNILAEAMMAIFVDKVEFFDWDEDWAELFAQLTLEVFDRNVVIFRPFADTVRILQNASPKILIVEYTFNDIPHHYPVFNITRRDFLKEGNINKRIFENFAQLDAIIPVPKINNLSHLLSIAGVTVHKQFLNKAGKCYAVLASYSGANGGLPGLNNIIAAQDQSHSAPDQPMAYIPVLASPMISRVPVQYKPFASKDFSSLSLATSLAISAHMFGERTATLWNNNRCVGYVHGELHCYITPTTSIPLELESIPRITLCVDIEDVNLAIYDNRRAPTAIYDEMYNAYYNNYFYKILKIEILHLIDHSPLNAEGQPIYTADTLRAMTPSQLAAIIPHEMRDKGKMSSNIIIPCGMKSRSIHCADTKLIVPREFEEFLEILLFDLNDPIRDFVQDTERSFVINLLDFVNEPGEHVKVVPVK